MTERAAIGPITCAGCSLLCDDVMLDEADGVVRLAPQCALGAAWFSARLGRAQDAAQATIDGRPADVEAALRRAAELLRAARRPALYGFESATVEDARAAVALADRLGALVVTESSTGGWPGPSAFSLRGASAATLGEIRDRSALVVIWREDPQTSHPRLLQRLGFGGAGTGGAPAARTLAVVDDRETPTAQRAGLRLRWPRERDLQALVTLHAWQRGADTAPGELDAPLRALREHVERVPHVAFVHGAGLTGGDGGQRRALALFELTRALSHDRHAVTLALPHAAGVTGARDALAWQTGFTGNVDLAGGHPELVCGNPQPLADTGDVDVAVCVDGAAVPLAPRVAAISLSSMPASRGAQDVAVTIRTAAAGVEAAGTAHRLDGVPLSLQAPRPGSAPTAAALLTRLLSDVSR